MSDVMQTPIRNESRRYLLGLALIIGTLCFSPNQASAAEVPHKYRGIWTLSDSCEQAIAAQSGEFPFLVVTNEETVQHETSCKIASVKRAPNKDTLNFRCSGEGEKWELNQVWSVRDKATDIDGGMLVDRMTIKVRTLVVSDPEYKLIYKKCGAVCIRGECWGEQ